MNYHTNLLASPVQRLPAQKEPETVQESVTHGKLYLFIKRCFDVVFSFLFIALVMTWLVPIVSILIIVDSNGPIFFTQRRIGRNGRSFFCLKFRTMIVNDEADEKQADENDYRITRVGKFLRRTNLDELPQFINILTGAMSIIGPRPHMFSDYTRFSFVIPGYHFRSLMRPGITGLAQVKGHHGPTLSYKSILVRYHWDAEYVRKANFLLDLRIAFATAFQCIKNIIYLSLAFIKGK